MNTLFIFLAKYFWILSVVIVLIYFIKQNRTTQKKMVVFGLLTLILAYVLGFIAGHLYYDPRPFVVGNFTPLIPHAADNGFPSDHTLITGALAAFVVYYNKRIGYTLWIIALIVGIARVYVGVHHLRDIVVSLILALIAALISHYIVKKSWKNQNNLTTNSF